MNSISMELLTKRYGGLIWAATDGVIMRKKSTKDLKNAKVKNGCLYITALYDAKNKSYTSARLKTKGNKDFLYGKIEVRAKLPKGKEPGPPSGLWQASQIMALVYGRTMARSISWNT